MAPAESNHGLFGQMHNADVAAVLDTIADMLEIAGANRLRIRAYRNAGRLVHSLPEEVSAMIARGADLDAFNRKASGSGVMMELNAHPDRLDLTDTYCHMARDMGVRVCLGTDAHSASDLDFMRFGIGQARRGWLEARHVANTLPLASLRKVLRRKPRNPS